MPVDSELEVNAGILRTKHNEFLQWILEETHPYQFREDVGIGGTLCEKFLLNAKHHLQ